MRISNIIYFITLCGLSQSQSQYSYNLLSRRGYGSIAASCSFESRLKAATTEPVFNQIMDDCNFAYSKLLAQNPSQQNAITLQSEIVYIKEQFSIYKNNYFLTHPPSQTSTSPSTTSTSSSTTTTSNTSQDPNPTILPGQTIFQRCDLENKIKNVQKREEFNVIYNSCGVAYNQLLNNNPSRINELNNEWLLIQARIAKANQEFQDKPTISTSSSTSATPSSTTTSNSVTSTTTSSGPVPTGQTVTQRCNLENSINNIAKIEEFDSIVSSCSKAYSEILTRYPERNAELGAEWQTIVNRIQAAKIEFARTHPSPTSTSTTTSTTTTSTTTTSTTTTPTTSTTTTPTTTPPGPVPTGQTVTQRCNLESSISKVTKADQFDGIVSSCSKAYSEILTAFPSRNAELGAEWQTIVNRIQAAKIEFSRTHPSSS